ncbi:adenylate/guanylate cyclase domain-containing protein [Bradyrhizobium sp. Bra64]|uniref:adenylate/guanylate cyclase domain-containing protein n=1 Tax=Bradyrhizobium sp. Bra64 TaxID=2926009 RepID=UPI002118A043|nr:adenylate/guanylate cyclase domain-containing protein [Bradyrhizobium sp. Bra64]
MTGERVERRLVAVLAADVAGYSRLMGADEEGTLARLKEARKSVVDATISAHRGRIVKTTGDGMLVEFASAVDAARSAVEVQRRMAAQNADVSPAMRIEFRIGIHIGDIIIDDNDIFGDGVNIAARLEGIADPGGICVSDDARRQIRGKIDVAYDDMGLQALKNIAEPMHAWRLLVDEYSSAASTPGQAPEIAGPLALPDKPSIAVLPFQNMSPDPDQEFFADGIAQDVITALSRYSSLFVIARNSSFSFKGRAVDVKQVGRELGVRYVLEGGLRKSGNRVRVTAQLVEAETGKHVWAERYDRDIADIFSVQDDIAQSTTIAIAPVIAGAEQQRAMRKPPASLDAWGAYQRGMWHLGKASAEDDAVAGQFFQRAIDLDPMFAPGYIGLSTVLSRAKGTQVKEEELARRAVALDGGNADAHSRLALALNARGDHSGAHAQAERALALCPNLAAAHGALGVILAYSGRPKEGLVALETCIRLDPRDPSLVNRLNQVALAHYFCRDYAAAVETAEHATRTFPDFPSPYRWLAAALGQLGRTAEAEDALQKAIAISSTSFEFQVRQRPPWFRPEDHALMLDGLHKAGWED